MTFGELYAEGRAALERADIPNAALDARVLWQYATGRSWASLIGDDSEKAPHRDVTAFSDAIAQRLKRMPIAQITGRKEFWSLDFKIGRSTLIPRPESEHIIEQALKLVPPGAAGRTLDLGTGSGCLLISLLTERPRLSGVGIDRSYDALVIARENAERMGVADRCAFVQGDWAKSLEKRFDLVIANPPYLSAAELRSAPPEVADHEPHLALFAGMDGLAAYREIAPALPRLLVPGGHAVIEIGATQSESVRGLLALAGLESIETKPDLAGLPRVVTAQKPLRNKDVIDPKKKLESAS